METQAARAIPMADAGRPPVIPSRTPMEDKPTLRQVFETEESPLLRFAFSLVGQREAAEDLVQEAFLKLHAHWEDVATPRAWLFRAVRNLSPNHLRDHQRESHTDAMDELPAEAPGPALSLGRMETLGTLQLLVAELDPTDRQLIQLKYRENLKYDQISERTGLSVGNVGYKLHHLLKNLADSMRRMGIESSDG